MDRIVWRDREVPVERVVVKEVAVMVDRIVEKFTEVPVERIVYKEVPVEVRQRAARCVRVRVEIQRHSEQGLRQKQWGRWGCSKL